MSQAVPFYLADAMFMCHYDEGRVQKIMFDLLCRVKDLVIRFWGGIHVGKC